MPLKHISCAPGAHIGELITRNYLMQELAESDGFLLSNYHHPHYNGTDEIDLVLINERGVWLLEVKHWRGRIDASGPYWLHNGQQRDNPMTSIETKAKRVAAALRQAGMRDTSIVGLVVLSYQSTFGTTPPDVQWRKLFFLEQSLIDAVCGSDYLFHPQCRRLTASQRQHVCNLLIQHNTLPSEKTIGNYRLVGDLVAQAGYDVGEAVHLSIEPPRRARVKRYHTTAYQSYPELEAAVHRFKREVRALESLAGHPHILRVYDFHPDPHSDDTWWLFLEWNEGQTLQEKLAAGELIGRDEQRHIIQSLAVALDACHHQEILHRNLTPASVLLGNDGRVKLGDFDLARVPGMGTTISITGKPMLVGKYAAPELRDNTREPDARSDLYALGAIWYDMALRRLDDTVVFWQRIAEAPLPPTDKALLQSLVALQPSKRPASAAAVVELMGEG